jgi:hypothetical protein
MKKTLDKNGPFISIYELLASVGSRVDEFATIKGGRITFLQDPMKEKLIEAGCTEQDAMALVKIWRESIISGINYQTIPSN